MPNFKANNMEKENVYPIVYDITIADNGIVIADKEEGLVVVVEDTTEKKNRIKQELGDLLMSEIEHFSDVNLKSMMRVKISVEGGES